MRVQCEGVEEAGMGGICNPIFLVTLQPPTLLNNLQVFQGRSELAHPPHDDVPNAE